MPAAKTDLIRDIERLRDQFNSVLQRVIEALRSPPGPAQLPVIRRDSWKRRQQRMNPKDSYPNNIARNIDMLRLECKYSFDDLAEASGIDKRTILRHLSGMQPRLRMLQRYAEIFSTVLGREITPSDLMK
jgi:hypothetical protein